MKKEIINWADKNLDAFNSWHKKRVIKKEQREKDRMKKFVLSSAGYILVGILFVIIIIPAILFGWILRILRIETED